MLLRVLEDPYRAMDGHPTECSVEGSIAAIDKLGDSRPKGVPLLAARLTEAHEAVAAYDREPNDLNLRMAVDAMANATMTRDGEETARQTLIRLLPAFPPRRTPVPLLTLLVSSAARERRVGETLGRALDRLLVDDVALRWAHDVVVGR